MNIYETIKNRKSNSLGLIHAKLLQNSIKNTVKEITEVKMATVGFYLDVLSIFPANIFSDTLDPNKETIFSQLVVLLPILQIWHIWDYLSKWETNFNVSVKVRKDFNVKISLSLYYSLFMRIEIIIKFVHPFALYDYVTF